MREELTRLGPWTRGQRNVLVAFGVTVFLWIAPGFRRSPGSAVRARAGATQASVPESVAAMIGAFLLFLLPLDWRKRRFTLTWDQASRIDWGIILLYGGGLALGDLAFSTGLARWLGDSLTSLLPSHTERR